jgi:putative ABC transport system permease protein
MPGIISDVRYGVRMLAKSPAATAVAVLALGLGIGANSSMFTLLRSMVLRPLPFSDMDQVVALSETTSNNRSQRYPVSPANFLDWKEQAKSFRQLAAYRWWDVNLTGVSDPERLQGYAVSPEFFPLLGMAPQLGRSFSASEAQPGRDEVVVLSNGFWKRRFAADPAVIGRTLSLEGRAFTVIGIMPEEFDFPLATDLWAPLAFTPQERSQRGVRSLSVIGRLKPEISLSQARAAMDTIAAGLDRRYVDTNEHRGVDVVRVIELTNPVTDRFIMVLMAAASFVLLLACANVANLQLARSASRSKELAVRAALGASRWRIARQLLVEAVLVSLAGGVLASFLAVANIARMRTAIPAQVYKWVAGLRNMEVDATVLGFTFASAVFAGIFCGLGAALQAARKRDLNDALKEGGRSSAAGADRGALRKALVIAEVALAMVLMVGAGLMVKAFRHIAQSSPGYNPSHLLTMRISLQEVRYPAAPQQRVFYDNLRRRLDALPEVVAAAMEGGQSEAAAFSVEGRPASETSANLPIVVPVTPGYFRAMGMPVLRGRPFGEQDSAESQPVAVLSKEVARRYWEEHGANPVGSRIRLGGPESQWLAVVGVAGEVKDWFGNKSIPLVYTAFAQAPQRSASVLMRTRGNPLQLAAAARAEVLSLDRNQPVYDLKTMESDLSDRMSGVKSSADSMAVFAAIALILSASGTYAVIAYSVARRSHEMGIRVALGARPQDVLRLVVGQALRLALGGLAIGLPTAYGLSRLMSSAVYGVVTLEWTVFIGFTLLLAASAALAGYLPARRAASVDPAVALRAE